MGDRCEGGLGVCGLWLGAGVYAHTLAIRAMVVCVPGCVPVCKPVCVPVCVPVCCVRARDLKHASVLMPLIAGVLRGAQHVI